MKFSRLWDRLFPKRAREYLQFPAPYARPLPFGTVLIAGDPPVISDGKGGVTVPGYENTRRRAARASRRRTG